MRAKTKGSKFQHTGYHSNLPSSHKLQTIRFRSPEEHHLLRDEKNRLGAGSGMLWGWIWMVWGWFGGGFAVFLGSGQIIRITCMLEL